MDLKNNAKKMDIRPEKHMTTSVPGENKTPCPQKYIFLNEILRNNLPTINCIYFIDHFKEPNFINSSINWFFY